LVVGLPLARLWIEEDDSFQVGQEFVGWLVEQPAHVVEVNATLFVQGNQKCFFRLGDGFNRLAMMNRPFGEDGGLGRPLCFVVVVLQRKEQRQIRVTVEGALVGAEIQRAEPGGEPVVSDVELLARFDDAFYRAAVHLGAQAVAHRVTHLKTALAWNFCLWLNCLRSDQTM